MLRHSWPGNIRSFENAIEWACALATGDLVELAGLPDDVRYHLWVSNCQFSRGFPDWANVAWRLAAGLR